MVQVNTMTASPRFLSSGFHSVRGVFLTTVLLLAALLCGRQVQAEDRAPRATLVIFGDRHMSDDFWTALVEELHKTQTREATMAPALGGDFDVLRGDKPVPAVDSQLLLSITIIGDCSLRPGPRKYLEGALGWVREEGGEIRPFIHVDCDRIVEMLGPIALGMKRDRRNTVMAEAVSRVVVHEWIHVATQTAAHTKRGVMQSQFELSDLLAYDEQVNTRQINPRHETRRCKKESCGL